MGEDSDEVMVRMPNGEVLFVDSLWDYVRLIWTFIRSGYDLVWED